MDSIDKILSELQAEYQQSANSPAEKTEEVKNVKKVKKIKLDSSPSSSIFASSSKGDVIDNILAEVKQDVEEKQLLEEQQKLLELEEERIRQEKLKAHQLEALKSSGSAVVTKIRTIIYRRNVV